MHEESENKSLNTCKEHNVVNTAFAALYFNDVHYQTCYCN